MTQDTGMRDLPSGLRYLLALVAVVIGLGMCVIASSAADGTSAAWPGVLVLAGGVVMVGGVWLAFFGGPKRSRQFSAVNAQTGAGWYPDPDSPSMRFWDGEAWTDQRAPLPQRSTNLSAWTIARGVAVGIIIVVVLLALFNDSSSTGYGY